MGKSKAKRKDKRKIGPTKNIQDLPVFLQQLGDGLASIGGLLQRASGDIGEADKLAVKDLGDLALQLKKLAAPFDAFDIIECVRLSNSVLDPDSYKESEFEGSAESVELCALIMSSRSGREGSAPDEEGHRASPDPVMDEITELLAQLRRRVSDHVFLKAAADHNVDSDLYFRAALKEVHLRMPTYPHMMEESLRELFTDADLDVECRKAIGFTGLEAIDVLLAIEKLNAENWRERFQAIREADGAVRAAFECHISGGAIDPVMREHARSLWKEAWSDYSDGTVTTSTALALQCGLSETTVKAVVDAFALEMPGEPADEAIAAFANGRSAVRLRPLIKDRSGEFAFVSGALLLPSLRENIETHLKATSAWPTYDKRRATFLEATAARYLSLLLPPAKVTNSIKYFVPDLKAAKPEVTSSDYSKLVESDSLFVVDDVAIIVEAKAGSITEGTRAGDPMTVDRDLKKLIAEANDQAERIRKCIGQDGGLRLRDGSWLDLSFVRETYVIAVTLEDLANITALSSDLEAKGIVSSKEHPWITSLHDLRIVSEIIDRPSEFLLFLRRRTDPFVTRKFHAIEELDYVMAFLSGRLFVEPDPKIQEVELPKLGKARVADKRRFANQPVEIFPSLTDPLDAWYFSELGWRAAAAAKPRLRAEPNILTLVDELAVAGQPGWSRIGATLLNGNSKTQKNLVMWMNELVESTERDGRTHSVTVPGGNRLSDSFVLTIATRSGEESVTDALGWLADYTTAKKHQWSVAMGAGLLIDSKSPVSLLGTVYDTSPLRADPALDAKIESKGLKQVTSRSTRPASWQRKKRGRTSN